MKRITIFIYCTYIFSVCWLLIYCTIDHTLETHLEIDSTGYHAKALHFAHNNSIVLPEEHTQGPITAAGYPLLLGLLYKAGYSYKALLIIQYCIALFCIWLIISTTYYLSNASVALLAGILASINVGFLVYSYYLLTEIVLAALLLWFVYYTVLFFLQKKELYLIYAGFLAGLSIWIKGTLLFYIPCIAFVIAWQAPMIQKALLYIGLFFGSFLIPVSVYMTFNYYCYGFFSPSSQIQENIYLYFLPKVIASVDTIPYKDACLLINNHLNLQENRFSSARWQPAQAILYNNIICHPLVCSYLVITNIIKTTFGLFTTQLKVLLNQELKGGSCSYTHTSGTALSRMSNYITMGTTSGFIRTLAWLELCYLLIRLIFVMIALAHLLYYKHYALSIFFISYVGYTLMCTFHDGAGRYRMMHEGILIELAALGASVWYQIMVKPIRRVLYVS